jgi:hypothetical protein
MIEGAGEEDAGQLALGDTEVTPFYVRVRRVSQEAA